NFYLGQRWCGEASRNLDVRRDASVPPLAEIPPPEGPSWRTGLTLEPGAVPPDLIVRIQRGAGVGHYTWSCLSPHGELSPPDDPADALMSLGSDAVTFVRQQFGSRANRPLGRMDLADIEGIGEEIYRATPTHFKDSYWTVRRWTKAAGVPFTSIQIVTDEPFIPWELMRLDDPKRGDGVPAEFLGIRHSVGRWLAEHVGGPRQRIPLGELAVAASDYDGIQGAQPLPWAGKERAFLETSHGATRVELRGEAVLDFLEGGTAHLVHFACHGQMSLQNPNDSKLVMEDAPNHVRPTHVARGRVRDHGLGRQHPLVFLNACDVGGSAEALSLVAGFPAAFLKAGASALVSPLWVVNDERAFHIAQEFYDTALAPGARKPLGQLLRDVRARWEEEGHLTYLAYVLYGDPLAWVDTSAAPGGATPPHSPPPTPTEP
ncbi:MAG: CHAT domain-containing protein, partial [Gemmatimonadales bacterium]